jgi:bifunctional non-homologous end joining protein LigD
MRDDVMPASVRREPELKVHTDRAEGTRLRAKGKTGRAEGKGLRAKGKTGRAEGEGLRAKGDLIEQLNAIEHGRESGVLRFPDGRTLDVSNLRKVFWPKLKITKGELMRYYVRVAPFLLPVVKDRPLIMKRFPNGISSQAFYQQRAPEKVPPGVRTATLAMDEEVPSRIIGGDLITLLYMAQLAVVSQDPWFSRVQSPETADHCAIDLDPMPGVRFAWVRDVALWVRDELDKLKVRGYPKTSGSSGIHIFIPLAPGTPYDAGQIFCQIVATFVAEKHPKVATVTRSVHARGQKVYVDYLQNILGKSLACAYSARASEFGGASTPITWKEIDDRIEPGDFTIRNLPDRLADVGDLWKPLLTAKGVDLRKIAT